MGSWLELDRTGEPAAEIWGVSQIVDVLFALGSTNPPLGWWRNASPIVVNGKARRWRALHARL